jgi:recombination protein RecT
MRTDGSDQNEKLKSLERSPVQSLKEIMNSEYVKKRFMEVMGEKSASFLSSILNAAEKNPDLAKCEPRSILSSAMVAATLDLPIDANLGFSAIIPYNTKRKGSNGSEYWVSVAQFQIMYKGFIQLALRSGQYKTINVSPVYEDEFESYDIITGDIRLHPVDNGFRAQENEEKIVGYAAFFRLLNGYERIEYWSLKKLQVHGKMYSKSYDKPNSLWQKNPHAMYAKTVLKNTLAKWGILSVTMQTAIVADQAVIKSYDKPIDGENVGYPDAREFSPETGNSPEETGPETEEERQPKAEGDAKKETVPAGQTSGSAPPNTPAETPETAESAENRRGEGLFSEDEEAALARHHRECGQRDGYEEGPDFEN